MTERPSAWWERPSVRQTEPWVESAISRGLTAAEGFRQYQAGGGTYGRSTWYEVFAEKFGYQEKAETIGRLSPEDVVPSRLWTGTGAQYLEEYAVKAEADVIFESGAYMTGVKLTVESSQRLTLAQWREAITAEVTQIAERYGMIEPDDAVLDVNIARSEWLRRSG